MCAKRPLASFIYMALAWSSSVALAQLPKNPVVGQAIDSLNGVWVYYNGEVPHVSGRNVAADGYNLGLKYQCVEFVKRYYYEHLDHRMPDSYGHAKDFFDPDLKDGQMNATRDLTQYANPSLTKPRSDDLLVYSATGDEQYGHVALISEVLGDSLEIIQQNPGPDKPARERYSIVFSEDRWYIENGRIRGWLRKQDPAEQLPEQ
ncbi:MAG: CHAP domain-containing protein [Flavobacteriales bacterium]|nr:CHAP domain-containing protein [Flavobacteriales bacterium]